MLCRKTLISIFLLVQIEATLIEGYKQIVLDGFPSDGRLSADSSTLLCSQTAEQRVIIMKNTGKDFEIHQKINLSAQPLSVDITKDGSKIFISFFLYPIINVYEQGSDGIYSQSGTISTSCLINVIVLSGKEDENLFLGCRDTGEVQIYKQNGAYSLQQTLVDFSGPMKWISITKDLKIFAAGSSDRYVRVYQLVGNLYTLQQTITFSYEIYFLKVSSEYLVIAGHSSEIVVYKSNGSLYELNQALPTSASAIFRMAVSADFQKFIYVENSFLKVYQKQNNSYALVEEQDAGKNLYACHSNPQFLYYLTSTMYSFIYYYSCPPECSSCVFPNYCTSCSEGYSLNGSQCIQSPNNCVHQKAYKGGMCEEYCHRSCKSCHEAEECIECAELYAMDAGGKCVVENMALAALKNAMPFMGVVKKRGFKMVFLSLEDLWLYNYHRQSYDGFAGQVFSTISFLQENQWEMIGLGGWLHSIESSIEVTEQYNPYSNAKYAQESRKNDFLLSSILDFLAFSIPLNLMMVFLLNRMFYFLFNYEVSKFLRVYSFWLVLVEILIQGNLEFFSFLGWRSFYVLFSFSLTCKAINAFVILFMFVVLLCSTTSYLFYHWVYGKMARYFINNMYRFQSSYILMVVCYGLRPFLKGCVHALFHDRWELQLWLLSGIELSTVLVMVLFKLVLDNYKSMLILVCQVISSLSLVAMNSLLLCKHHYFSREEDLKRELEVYLKLVVYLMLVAWVVRVVAEIAFALTCKSNSISPKKPQSAKKRKVKTKRAQNGKKGKNKPKKEPTKKKKDGEWETKDKKKFANLETEHNKVRLEHPVNYKPTQEENGVIKFYFNRHKQYNEKKEREEKEKKQKPVIKNKNKPRHL